MRCRVGVAYALPPRGSSLDVRLSRILRIRRTRRRCERSPASCLSSWPVVSAAQNPGMDARIP